MGGFSELIKNFEKTRDYVRDFFIYGFKVRSDFGQKSSRTYDDEKRRIESWLGNYMSYEDSKHGRQTAITVDSGHISENPLYQAYYSRSFTDNDIKLHFFLLDILSSGESLPLKELVNLIDENFEELFDEQTVRNKLKEYTSEGILISEKIGKTAYFRLSPDTVEDFINTYGGLTDAVKFYSCMPEFGEVGSSILKDCGLKNDLFFIKHNYIVHTLEDSILPEILDAIENRQYLSFENFSSRNNFRGDSPRIIENIVPMQIFSSVQTGRRYMAGYNPKFMCFNSYRLDFIKKVRAGKYCEDYEEIQKTFQKSLKKCFGVSFAASPKNSGIKPLEITFHIDEENEAFVTERLNREKRNGTLEKTGRNTFLLTLDVSDPNETMQWIKTFIGRIVSIKGGNEQICRMFYSDIERMHRMYGGKTDDDIQ